MEKYGRIALLIVLIAVLIGMIFVLRQRIFGSAEKAELKLSATALSDPRQCQIKVTVDRPPSDVDLAVTVTVKPGIYFIENGQGSVTRDIGTLFPREERILTFNCFLKEDTALYSGAYVVKAVAKHRAPRAVEGEDYATGTTLLYVELRPDVTNIFLPDKEAFDALFSEPYEQGAYYQYKLDLESIDKPRSGLLHVRINSKKDDFSSNLYVVVSGGVAFGQPDLKTFVQPVEDALVSIRASGIDSGGSRIISIPFSVVADAIPGSYGIKVLQAGQGEAPGEMAPLYIGVTNSPESPDQLWLTPDLREDAPLLTPAPTRSQ